LHARFDASPDAAHASGAVVNERVPLPPRGVGRGGQRQIAVLGGGMGALTTAFELTQAPGWRSRYAITVYQLGWRLGGKGASGRARQAPHRITEHGLHMWAGYYDNAFEVIRACYDELGRDPEAPLATWRDAFRPRHHFSLHDDAGDEAWTVELPPGPGEPGDGRPATGRERLKVLTGALWLMAGQLRGRAGLRRAAMAADLAGALGRGWVADGLWRHGPSAIDHRELREWLRDHGARETTLDGPLLRAIYDTVFAYQGGDTERPSLSAGRALHTLARFVGDYRGAVFWEMQGGMGEVVFTPLYQLLRRRGVRFDFFHAVQELHLGADGGGIDAIDMRVQAELHQGADYDPLIDVGGLACWPAQPLWEQLVDGDRLRERGVDFEASEHGLRTRRLQRGADFDEVVLGISLGALAPITGQLAEASPAWRGMLQHVPTVATQALQLWLDQSAEGPRGLRTGGAQPLNTWADMSFLLPSEQWPTASGVRQLAYFCGPRSDTAPASPAVTGGMDWVPELGGAKVVARYARANTSGSERYVLSTPESLPYRLTADGSGFDNLVLAGDWVRTEYDLGTIEAATTAGRYAAHALAGGPTRIHGQARFAEREAFHGRVHAPLKPRYIERGGDPCYRPPTLVRKGSMMALPLRADIEALRALCDRQLNAVAGPDRSFVPAGDAVWLCYAHLPQVGSDHPVDRDAGVLGERELSFMVPVVERRRVAGRWWPRATGVLPLFLLVDHPWAVLAGRELYGFPKSQARFEVHGVAPAVRSVVAHAPVLREHGPTASVVEQPLVSIVQDQLAPRLGWGRELVDQLGAQLRGADSQAWPAAAAQVALGPHALQMFFLKQFRNAVDPDHACYQALVCAEAQASLQRVAPLPEARSVRIWPSASHPIVAELGLQTQPQDDGSQLVEGVIALSLELDFSIQAVTETEREHGRVARTSAHPGVATEVMVQ
jgi:uncharacterized protein with NAD-binding domain and iron-sulfur cluster